MDSVAQQVLDFWFKELTSDQWFNGGEHIDALITSQFTDIYAGVIGGKYDNWCTSALESLAYIIVIDQFSRNMFRNAPEMFTYDFKALECVKNGLAAGYIEELQGSERLFFLMPLIHSEDLDDQVLGVASLDKYCSDLPGYEMSKKFFDRHREIIEIFGRFPHRNKILGRESDPKEVEFLQGPFSSF